jgi:chromosomal replication initiation ATPase DnaA
MIEHGKKIVEIVKRQSGVDITEHTTRRDVAEVRQIAFYIIRMETDLSYQKIARMFGLKSARTVLYGINLVTFLFANDSSFRDKYESMMAKAQKDIDEM